MMDSLADLSKAQLLKLLELQDACIHASSDRGDVNKIIELLRQTIPFESALISFNIEADIDREGLFANFGFSNEWLTLYKKKGLSASDPAFSYAQQTQRAFDYEQANQNFTGENAQFLALAREFGVSAGICNGCEINQGKPASTLINLCASQGGFDKLHLLILEYVTPHIHQLFNQQGELRDVAWQVPALTKAESEVLKWCREGKTAWEMGVITARSERTIKFHLSNIYKKLDVSTRTHAVAKALRLGVLEY